MDARACAPAGGPGRGSLYLLQLHEVGLQALGFLLILFGSGKDLISGGTGIFQLSLEVLHLSLRESVQRQAKMFLLNLVLLSDLALHDSPSALLWLTTEKSLVCGFPPTLTPSWVVGGTVPHGCSRPEKLSP